MTHFEFTEHQGDRLIWQIRKSPIDSFNLILGDNAQGKTRFFNILRFLKNVHSDGPAVHAPGLKTYIEMTFDENGESVIYKFNRSVRVDGLIPDFSEEIIRQGKLIFSREQKILIEEISGKKVENFFLPPNVPALLSINGEEFSTIVSLKSFFERMLFLEANRFAGNNIEISKDALVINSTGSNIGSVLDTWRRKMPEAFNEIVSEFQDCFSFVVEDSVTTKEDILPGHGVSVPFAFYTEKESNAEIRQLEWSDGMLRSLCLFALAATRFPQEGGGFQRPSFVCVDEIENGLDFNTLKKVISFYEGYSNIAQVILASHSPTVCNLVESKYWHIAKRKGAIVELFSPREKEKNFEEQRKKLLKDNWEFYKNHVAKSKLYSVE